MRQTEIDCGSITGGLCVSTIPDRGAVVITPGKVTPFSVSLHLTADEAASLRDELSEAIAVLDAAKAAEVPK